MPEQPTFLDRLDSVINLVDGFVWGPSCLIPFLLGIGILMMIGLRLMPIVKLVPGFKAMWRGRRADPSHKGELSPFHALMASMAATVGTGNIVGVATAITVGGPGAVFWMWVTALFGMATKFCEVVLAVNFREKSPDGSYVGGPMYYIRNGMGEEWRWMATLFAFFGICASFGIGNMTQGNAIGANLAGITGGSLSTGVTAAILFVLVGAVLLGGVKRIGAVCGTLVPVMALIYVICGLVVLIIEIDAVPAALGSIFAHAFSPSSAVGGFAGATVTMAMRFGIARGLFSNEAGLGSAPITHATAITDSPVRQGMLGMLDPFLDTIVVCTFTALVILVAGHWTDTGLEDAGTLAAMSFDTALPGLGRYMVTIGIVLFAFSTLLGWSIYGERCARYLFGDRAAFPYRVVFTCVVPAGVMAKLGLVWDFADLANGLMALPNLIAVLILCPVVFKLTKQYFADPANR